MVKLALYLAILNKQTDIVQLLSEAKMDIHAINTRGRTLLHLAASAGHLETVKVAFAKSGVN